jgi:hypothetical protein
LKAIGQDIRDKLDAQVTFDDLVIQGDDINFYKLLEKVVQESGSDSIYQSLTRFFRLGMKDGATWAAYLQEWKDVVATIKRQGSAEAIREAILQICLVMTVDQALFKEILALIYGTTIWPSTNQLIDRFTAYATNKEVISNVLETGGTGRIAATCL